MEFPENPKPGDIVFGVYVGSSSSDFIVTGKVVENILPDDITRHFPGSYILDIGQWVNSVVYLCCPFNIIIEKFDPNVQRSRL